MCAPCLDHPPSFDTMRSSVVYNDVSRHLVLCFKHGDMLQLAPLMARWMVQAGGELLKNADLIIPVPLHRYRLIRRQYNQAAILVNQISKIANLKKNNEALLRVRHTPSQGKKKYEERVKNLKASIQTNPKYLNLIKGKKILLVDDVYTTGATVQECCRVLKLAGAEEVNILTFARVVKGRN